LSFGKNGGQDARKEILMWRAIKRAALCGGATLVILFLSLIGIISWPKPLFAFSLSVGKITVASDRPIPAGGGERLLRDCERLLERSPLTAKSREYRLYVTNADWRHRLFFVGSPNAGGVAYNLSLRSNAFLSGADFETGRLIKWGYVTTPPRTLAYFCAHELTHVVTGEHTGLIGFLRLPEWVREGFADYVAIEHRQSFEQLRDALGERPVDIPMMQTYGSYPRYRLLVTYFIEKQGWSVEQLLNTRLTTDEALAIMRADTRR
jgi:hypothetical protein